MVTTAGKIREMLAAMPDDAPVYADVWTAKELESRISDLRLDAEQEGLQLRSTDLTDRETLLSALNCIPNIWAMGYDDAEEELMEMLRGEFVREGGAE